ncbi:nucleotidyltransferase domain-containing protein [Spirosoma endbachense]|uniref:Polymerase nucleotidyl transferase domain-containing protein n=1 Tax=Spirosoma endbachense TaxID=2666025 RepID=A0A6P1W3A5_9BACT|nr:nucleotidyltransferase domain-containing protein [Spirosoma endbachense]QHV99911.1 hypothetical protein GJR95_35030 [Spirosoma endbachense]
MELVGNETVDQSTHKQETLNILVYANIFNYPLTKKEIYERGKIDISQLETCLINLRSEKKIFLIEDFYTLHNDNKIIENRKKRNKRADIFINRARIITRVIAHFPFIRAVFLSGSISKDCMDENSDIDFFIITEPERLWIAHLFCSVFRHTFLLNSSKYFCYNYLIDSEHLLIEEQSLYTAIEIKTLIPLLGYNYYKNMLQENEWTNNYFPKYPLMPKNDISKNFSFIQRSIEFCFNNAFGNWLDKWLLNYSIKKRKKKFESKLFEYSHYYIDLQRHVAKSHITDKYPKIMKKYFEGIEQSSCI